MKRNKMKRIEIRTLLIAILFISMISISGAVPNSVQNSQNIPEGYQHLSDIGIIDTDIYNINSQDILIPSGFFEQLKSDFKKPEQLSEIKKLSDKLNNKKGTKSSFYVYPKPADDIQASVGLSANVLKLWNKTFTGNVYAIVIPDINGDKFDDVITTISYPDYHQELKIMKGTSGQVLWGFTTAPYGWVYGSVVPDVDGDGINDLLLQYTRINTSTFKTEQTIYMKKGNTGANLWTESFSNTNTITGTMFGYGAIDLTGDKLTDILITKYIKNSATKLDSYEIKTRRGKDGVVLWKDSGSIKGNIFAFPMLIGDLDRDNIADVIIDRFGKNTTTNISFYDVKAKKGTNGANIWTESSSIKNGNVKIDNYPVGDVSGDSFTDVFVEIFKGNATTGNISRTMKVKRGYDGFNLWAQSNSALKGWKYGTTLPIGDLNKDNRMDLFYMDYRKNLSSTIAYTLTIKTLQAKDGSQLWKEVLNGKYNQYSVSPTYGISDINGDTNKDMLILYSNFGNITLKTKTGYTGSNIWQQYFPKNVGEILDVNGDIMYDLNGDSLADVIVDVNREKAGISQSDKIMADVGKTGVLIWQDYISGITANFFLDIVEDMNKDGTNDFLLNGHNTSSTGERYLYKVKNAKTGINLWSESSKTTMYTYPSGDLRGDGIYGILKYSNPSIGLYNVEAKRASTGTFLWKITSNVDIENAAWNTYSNFNGDTKDDILFYTDKDVYAITTK